MTAIAVPQIYAQYQDLDGSPLENGYVYIGIFGENPETSPIAIYYDSAATQPAAQPLRTLNGFVYRAGTPTNIYINTSQFSITVRNQQRELVITDLEVISPNDNSPAAAGTRGDCIFVLDGSVLSTTALLMPCNGVLLTINSVNQTIPDEGVSISSTALVAGTDYFIYASMSGANMILSASETAPVIQAGVGIMIKTGDPAYTLVGRVRPITASGVKFKDDKDQRFLRTWFSNSGIGGANYVSESTITDDTWEEVDSGARAEFLAWESETMSASAIGSAFNAGSQEYAASLNIGLDGAVTVGDIYSLGSILSADSEGETLGGLATFTLTSGYHYITLVGQVNLTEIDPTTINENSGVSYSIGSGAGGAVGTTSTGSAAAAVEWDITGAVSFSINVASVTDNGAGNFTIIFDIPFADADYVCVVSCSDTNPPVIVGYESPTTTDIIIKSRVAGGTLTDSAGGYSAVFYGVLET